jgi:transmembrane sensor
MPTLTNAQRFTPIDSAAAAVGPRVVEQAAAWLVRLRGNPDEATHAACMRWRLADPAHDVAWRSMEALSQDFSLAGGGHVSPAIVGETLNRYAERNARRRALKWMVSTAGVGIAAWAGGGNTVWRQRTADYRTATGERRAVTLSDGTQLTLNTGSSVDVRFNTRQRQVVLHAGEILVQTGHDLAGRPFRLVTPSGVITPIGTRFVTRLFPDADDTTRVMVMEGAVEIVTGTDTGDASNQPVLVQAGQQALFSARQPAQPTRADFQAASWADGMLVANRMRLDHFLAELGRYRPGILDCTPEVAERLVTGAFRVDDTDRALGVLAGVLGLTLRYRTRYWVTVAALVPDEQKKM